MNRRTVIINAFNNYLQDAEKKMLEGSKEIRIAALDTARNLGVRIYSIQNEQLIAHLILSNRKLLQYLNNGSSFFELIQKVKSNSKRHELSI